MDKQVSKKERILLVHKKVIQGFIKTIEKPKALEIRQTDSEKIKFLKELVAKTPLSFKIKDSQTQTVFKEYRGATACEKLADYYAKLGDFESAEEVLRFGLKTSTNSSEVWCALGVTLRNCEKKRDAKWAFRNAIRTAKAWTKPQADARINLAEIYYSENKFDAGIGILAGFKASNEDRTKAINTAIAFGYRALGREDKALILLGELDQSDLDILEKECMRD